MWAVTSSQPALRAARWGMGTGQVHPNRLLNNNLGLTELRGSGHPHGTTARHGLNCLSSALQFLLL